MSLKRKVLIVSYSLFLLIFFSGLWLKEVSRSNYYKQQLENEYSYALHELNAGLNNISIILEKSKYTSDTAKLSEMAAKLYSEAEIAKTALSRLPVDAHSSGTVGRFLSQVGNYSLSIARNAIRGSDVSDQQTENLELLSKTANTIAQTVGDTQLDYNNHKYWADELENRLKSEEIEGESLNSSLSALEEELTDFPTLIYDGPFSEHLLNREPIFLKDKEKVTQKKAEEKARSVVPQTGQFNYKHQNNGEVPIHLFENETVTVAISENGGYLIYLRAKRFVNQTQLSYSQALSKAKLFLNQLELGEMQATYYFTDNGVCIINFAAVQNGVLCYPDLIKVGVALDNGEIVFFESSGYIFNHTVREIPQTEYSREQALQKINPSLGATYKRMVVIPSEGGKEYFCYEFSCVTAEKKELLIYINTETLAEEQILILLKTDGGVLVK